MTPDVVWRSGGLIGLLAALGLVLGAWWLLHEDAGARIYGQGSTNGAATRRVPIPGRAAVRVPISGGAQHRRRRARPPS
jgi:hypothetical protein